MIEHGLLDLPFLDQARSTPYVQSVVQLSLAPAFLLAGIGAIMNVMTNRLIWVANRIERIEQSAREGTAGSSVRDLPALEQRRIYAQGAVMLSTAAALIISVVIALLFVSAFIQPRIGVLIAGFWILSMVLLVGGLALFLLETRVATHRNRQRMRERRDAHRRGGEGDGSAQP
ncbi:DUF2721 domain-containing protein [Erythrobacteraceae bacterium CFH 75059]|uniref:DUF2721 domain-containing protein n=1 Tax=Qipengyuania thermophila TaxID=2509361 RepID=UPI00102031DC|nr:DUF2721 domain-containing protein [Qipengyuania thermophila]TCD02021.1 DUF2721 domain-containing protein [Erythrobacteraceae bacterium CFH 75059]